MKRFFAFFCAVVLFLTSFPAVAVFANETDLVVSDADLIEVKLEARELFPDLAPKKKMFKSSQLPMEDTLPTGFMDYLLEHFGNCEESFSIEQFNISYSRWEELQTVILHETPELFHIYALGCRYYKSTDLIVDISANYLSYADTAAEYDSCLNKMRSGAGYLLQGVKNNDALTDVEKALILHDRLAVWTEYDVEGANTTSTYSKIHGAYSALGEASSVCQGYAMAYMYLLEQVGIESDYCSSNELNHGWNIVYIDGTSYHVDVTWDDPITSNATFNDVYGRVNHKNFLLSSNGIWSTGHEASDYNTTPTDTRYDSEGATTWWKDSVTAIQMIDNNLYYLDKSNGKVICADDSSTVHTLADNSSAYRLSSAEGMLLCSTYYDVRTIDPKTGLSSVFYTVPNGYMEGMKYQEGKLWVQLNDGNGNSRRESMDYVAPELTEYTYTVENDEATITGYTGAGGDVIIPATLGGYPVTTIGDEVFWGCTSMTSVKIPETVTAIGDYAFCYCTKLTSVTIPDSVKTIGEYAFAGYLDEETGDFASSLTSVAIGSGVTTIGADAFSACGKLASITIPDNVTRIDFGAFCFCYGLTSVTIGKGVTAIPDFAFRACEKLTTVTIPASVTTIGEYAFSYCTELTDVYYNGTEEQWNTVSVESGNEYLQNAIVHFPEPEVPEVTDYTYTVENGEATIEGYTGVGGDVIVPAVLDGYPVTKVGQAFLQNGEIVSVTIPDSVKTIGSYAFYKCEALEEVILGNGVVDIQDSAFMESPKLKSIVIPDSLITIGQQAFEGCTGMESVQFGSGLKTIARFAFYRCSALKNVTIPDGVTAIGEMAFAYSDALETVAIGGGLTTLGATVFAHCDALKSISVSAENEHFSSDAEGFFYNKDKTTLIQAPCSYNGNYTIDDSVTTISNFAFAGCKSLTGISIPDTVTTLGESAFWDSGLTYANIGGVSKIGDYAFSDCRVLAEVNISEGVTIIGRNSFDSCFMLENIVLPEGVEKIQSGAFNWCESLKEITIPASLTSVEWSAFYWCDSLTDVYYGGTEAQWAEIGIDETNTALISATIHCTEIPETPEVTDYTYAVENGDVTIYGYNGSGGDIVIPDTLGGYPVTGIGYQAFYNCANLTSVTIPNTVTKIEGGVFHECSNLISVTIGNSVTTIGDTAFYGCSSLNSVTIPDSVITIGNFTFSHCTGLISVTIPNSVTTIGRYAFESCESLVSVTIPDSISTINECVFLNCDSLASVTIPNSVTVIGDSAFLNCISLTAVTIPDSVTAIDRGAFNGCDSLTSVTIPDSVTTIGDYIFAYCDSLTTVAIGKNVTAISSNAFTFCKKLETVTLGDNVRAIGDSAFYYCDKLTSLTIPKSVLSIGNDVFYACNSLTDVYYGGSEVHWGSVSVGTGNEYLENAKIYYAEHIHSYIKKVTKPTCTAKGYTTYTCSCGDTYKADYVKAKGHSYAAATCTKPKTCKVCGVTSGKALGHSYKSGSCTRCKYKPAGVKITTQPVNVAVKNGKTATVTVKATGSCLKYTWYYAKKGAKTYTKTNVTTNTYSVKMSNSINGGKVYCVVTDQYGNSVKSNVVTLYKGTAVKITTQPKSTTVANGKTGSLTIKASGSSIKYQWYIKYKGASSFTKVGKSSKTYSFKMAFKLDGAQVYCVVKDKYGIEVKSSVVTLKMPTQPKITTQPVSTKAFSGKTVKFTVKASGDGLKYQWYYAKKGSSKFKKLSAKSATYSVKVSSSVNGRKYYCLVTDKYGQTVKSQVVTLTMQSAAKITTQPKNVSVKNGKTAKLTIKATGDGLKYTWYYLLPGATKYQKASATGNTFSVKMSAQYKNAKVYCTIADQYGNSVKSKTVTLKMK